MNVHLSYVMRVLRYLTSTSSHVVYLRKSSFLTISIYINANWVSYQDDRSRTNGFYVFLDHFLISWPLEKHRVMFWSSVKAKFKSYACATIEVAWLLKLLKKICVCLRQTPSPFCNNINARYLTQNPMLYLRTKYMEINSLYQKKSSTSKDDYRKCSKL